MSSPQIFDAFISYSRHDVREARWLQEHIQTRVLPETIAKRLGGKRRRLDRVFRDETDLVGHPALSEALTQALDRSAYLVVVCSPYAANSRYVDDEIRYFVKLGRRDKILCVIAGGDTEDEGLLNCFPPALRNGSPPLAADLRKGTDSFPDVEGDRIVAALLGGSLRELQADEARQRQHRARALLLLASIAIMGAGLAWDLSFRIHVTLSRNIVEVSGNWRESGILEPKQARRRGHLYRLYRKGHSASPHRIELVNGSGGRPEHPLEGILGAVVSRDCVAKDAYTIVITTANGRLTEERWLNPDGLEFEKVIYPDSTSIAEFREGAFGCSKTPSGIRYVRQRFDARGFEDQRFFLNDDRLPARNDAGVYGYAITRNDFGLPVLIRNLGPQGEYWPSAEGAYAVEYERDSVGEVSRARNIGLHGVPVRDSLGCAVRTFGRDDVGNLTRETCLGENGNPILNRRWYATVERAYDDRGNNSVTKYLDASGRATLNKNWVAREVRQYDAEGNVVEVASYGAKGGFTQPRVGSPIVRIAYDERGREIRRGHFDSSGTPNYVLKRDEDLNSGGYHEQRTTYDDFGQTLLTKFFDPDSSPVSDDDGIHGYISSWDQSHRRTRVMYLGVDGAGAFGKNGYAGWEQSFDTRGNVIASRYLGVDSAAAARADGVVRVLWDFDAAGNNVRGRSLGPDGAPFPDPNTGEYLVESEYDEYGRKRRTMFFGGDSQPLPQDGILGSAGYLWARDSVGRIVKQDFVDARGYPMERGLTSFAFGLDAAGNILRLTFLDRSGRLTLAPSGYAGVAETFDVRGLTLTNTPTDTAERPATGYNTTRYDYDARGLETRRLFTDSSSQLIPNRDGHVAHDARGNVKEIAMLGVGDDNTAAIVKSIERFSYDRWDRRIERASFSHAGRPVEDSDGIHATLDRYDEAGNLVERRYLNASRSPTVARFGYAGRRQKYDKRGLEAERVYFDLNDEPTLTTVAERSPPRAVELHHHDRHGRLEYRILYDEKLDAILLSAGSYGTLSVFGEDGRLASTAPLSKAEVARRGLLRHSLR